jgi:hypothetical protein
MFEDWEFEESEDCDCTPEILAGIEDFGKKCLKKFFREKEMHYGGEIHDASLDSEQSLDIIFHTCLEECVPKIYDAMEKEGMAEDTPSGISTDIGLVINILHECESLGIPKCFRGGILLLYLEFCCGIVV